MTAWQTDTVTNTFGSQLLSNTFDIFYFRRLVHRGLINNPPRIIGDDQPAGIGDDDGLQNEPVDQPAEINHGEEPGIPLEPIVQIDEVPQVPDFEVADEALQDPENGHDDLQAEEEQAADNNRQQGCFNW